MKLLITDNGDPSVGIFATSYDIDCPFDESIDDENREWFRNQIINVYKEICDGHLTATYYDEFLNEAL